MAKFGVTRVKSTTMVVDLKLDEFDKDEPDVDEPFRSLVGLLMWLPDSAGYPQRGSSGGKVLCSAKVISLAGSTAHRDVHQVYEHVRYYFPEGSE